MEGTSSPLVTVTVFVVVSPPQLQLLSEPTLDFGVVRAHSQTRRHCRLKNPSDVPTVARFRILPCSSGVADSLRHKAAARGALDSRLTRASTPPFSRYCDLIRSSYQAPDAPSMPRGCFAPCVPGATASPFEGPVLDQRGDLGSSTVRGSSGAGAHRSESAREQGERAKRSAKRACAKCSCVIDDFVDEHDKKVFNEEEHDGLTRAGVDAVAGSSGLDPPQPQGCPECFAGRHTTETEPLTFFPCWVVVPAHGAAEFVVTLNARHPDVLSRDVAVRVANPFPDKSRKRSGPEDAPVEGVASLHLFERSTGP
uniref:Uncharacterized protein n=1 Tax=Neospora caninum (strain Liverpool) TaxID=572307 RepID=A0A0F7UKV4_NEOCL|nr:TPA: hypothetical protein BN1204_062665 [Neospora caninum Liverpool]